MFTDLAVKVGLTLPELSEATREFILEKITEVNTSATNPVDLGALGFDYNVIAHTMKAMDRDGNIDVIVPYFAIGMVPITNVEVLVQTIVKAVEIMDKPVIPIITKFIEDDIRFEETRISLFSMFREAGLPVFGSMRDCIYAINSILQWKPTGFIS